MALAAAGAIVPATFAAGSSAAPRRGCSKLFTVRMGERAADAIYSGTGRVTLRQLRLMGYIERCQRNPAHQPLVRAYDREHGRLHAERAQAASDPFTGYVVAGGVSTFGPPREGAGTTADGGSDSRPCIALKDTSTLGRMFVVTIDGHPARLLHCDSGPYAGDRQIDVTGAGAYAMGLDPYAFPTDSYGIARELK